MSNEGETIPPTGDDRLETLLAQAGLDIFPDDVRSDVDAVLTSGQSLEPAVRKRFVDAAGRGARQWALRHQAPLERLLFEARRARKEDADTLAENIGISADTMRAIERGDVPLNERGPAVIASWALEVGFDRGLLADALRRSLGLHTSAPTYAGEHDVRLQPEQEQFVDDVLRAFDERLASGAD